MKKIPVYTKIGTYSTKQYNEKGQLLKEHPHLDKEIAIQRELQRKFAMGELYIDTQFGNNRQKIINSLQDQMPPKLSFQKPLMVLRYFSKINIWSMILKKRKLKKRFLKTTWSSYL
ncbi:MAG: hypothetical protein ACJAYJ_005070 [Saprospiraceae bacterium]|jgi:hypothetical protein